MDVRKDAAILHAARRLLLQGGPAQLTMEAVAQASGVSKATLYRRWPDRDALLRALVAHEAAPLLHTLHTVPPDEEALVRALVRFLDGLLCFVTRPAYRRYLQAVAALPQRRADLRRIWLLGPQQAVDEVAALLQRYAEQRGAVCAEAPREAEALIGMAMGLDMARVLYQQPPRHQRAAARRCHLVWVVRRFVAGLALGPGRQAGG
ncbi:helix-turn-helix domain-containing protein [Tepidimonas ignava]|uniref:TetR/AcrR family transcriptional regulator n=1 Tax=Tepidimonas ignava TaxID=114249 RepID=UPI002FDA96A3